MNVWNKVLLASLFVLVVAGCDDSTKVDANLDKAKDNAEQIKDAADNKADQITDAAKQQAFPGPKGVARRDFKGLGGQKGQEHLKEHGGHKGKIAHDAQAFHPVPDGLGVQPAQKLPAQGAQQQRGPGEQHKPHKDQDRPFFSAPMGQMKRFQKVFHVWVKILSLFLSVVYPSPIKKT